VYLKQTFLLSLSLLIPTLSPAALITADLRNSNSFLTQGAPNANNLGNVYTLTVGGVTITMTAFNIGANGGTTFQTAKLTPYSEGLGVCNSGELSNCGSDPQHRVDNSGSNDFVLFQFSTPVDVTSVTLVASAYNGSYRDTDANYWHKDVSVPVSLLGQTVANMNLGSILSSYSSTAVSSRSFPILDNWSDAFLIAGRIDDDNDYFKIKLLKFETMDPRIPGDEVPEPGTYATLGASLLALVTYTRSKNRK
jgi:hypothetical protein